MTLPVKELFVKKSKLPGAGKGLFTKQLIPKGTLIAEYKGKITTWKEVSHLHANAYLYYLKRDHVIDARTYVKSLARYANDANGLTKVKGLNNNSVYENKGSKVYIRATRNIPAGGEILTDYGSEYWSALRHNMRLDKEKLNKQRA